MSLRTELEEFLNQKTSSIADIDRRRDVFLYYFGFLEDDLPVYDDVVAKYWGTNDGNSTKRSADKAGYKIRLTIQRLSHRNPPLPSLVRCAEIISSRPFQRSDAIQEQMVGEGIFHETEDFNIAGVLRLLNALGYCKDFKVYLPNLKQANRQNYSRHDITIVIRDDLIEPLQSGIEQARELSKKLELVRFDVLDYFIENESYIEELKEFVSLNPDIEKIILDWNEYFRFHRSKEKLTLALRKIRAVTDRVPLDQLMPTLKRRILHLVNSSLKPFYQSDAMRYYLTTLDEIHIKGETAYLKTSPIALTALEQEAADFLRENPGVSFSELQQHLIIHKGYEESSVNKMIFSSPIIVIDESRGRRNFCYYLIGSSEESIYDPDWNALDWATQSKARDVWNKANQLGKAGELLVNNYLKRAKERQEIRRFVWVSHHHVLAPFDFSIKELDGTRVLVDVKTTGAGFDKPIHISRSELEEMCGEIPYRIYRVYECANGRAKLRISGTMNTIARTLVDAFDNLPYQARPDGISIHPSAIQFGDEIILRADN